MNRAIEFRGQDIETKEWYYGGLYQIGEEFYIVDGTGRYNLRAVIPETVGQYIGLDDKNNKKMYEGDIIKALKRDYDCRDDSDKCYQKFEVAYLNGYYLFGGWNAHEFFNRFIYKEIVGNKTDNPELLQN